MSESKFRVGIAECPEDWRDKFAHALAEEGHSVTPLDDEGAVTDVLSDKKSSTIDVLVLSDSIGTKGGIELLRAIQSATSASASVRVPPRLVYLSDGDETERDIDELTQLGVSLFLRRDAPLAQSVADIGRLTYGRVRRAKRYFVKWRVQLTTEEQGKVRGTMVDVSRSGCQIVLPRKHEVTTVGVGKTVHLEIGNPAGGNMYQVTAVVRRQRTLRVLLGSRIGIGVSFNDDPETTGAIEQLVEWAKAAEALLRSHTLNIDSTDLT